MSWSPASCVKLMKRGSSSDRPVWVVPVFSGVTACFDSLLNSFTGYKRTLYGLNDPYLTGNDEALTLPFEEWIGLYIAAMKTKQPSGPYTILAYSQGMHWAWAIDEVLRKQGDVGCDAIVVLDPNFPAWSSMDRVAAWDGPQMAKAMGAPFCMMYPMIKLMMGMMQSQAKWDTAAARDKTTSGSIAQMGAGVDLYEDMMARHAG